MCVAVKIVALEIASGPPVAIFGIESANLGCSCEHHSICEKHVDKNTVLRFKRTAMAGGKSMKRLLAFSKSSLTLIFNLPENNQYTTICAVYWATKGSKG